MSKNKTKRFLLHVNMGNDAFESHYELSRILGVVMQRTAQAAGSSAMLPILDLNGTRVGGFTLINEDEGKVTPWGVMPDAVTEALHLAIFAQHVFDTYDEAPRRQQLVELHHEFVDKGKGKPQIALSDAALMDHIAREVMSRLAKGRG